MRNRKSRSWNRWYKSWNQIWFKEEVLMNPKRNSIRITRNNWKSRNKNTNYWLL